MPSIFLPPRLRAGTMARLTCTTFCFPKNSAHARLLMPITSLEMALYPLSRAIGILLAGFRIACRMYSSFSLSGTTRLNVPDSSAKSRSLSLCTILNFCACAHGTPGRSLPVDVHTPFAPWAFTAVMTRPTSRVFTLNCRSSFLRLDSLCTILLKKDGPTYL